MKEIEEYEQDLASIRSMMEKSVKFISLSGLSGVLSGFYALGGATLAYLLIYYPFSPFGIRGYSLDEQHLIAQLSGVATAVLALSIGTGCLMSARKARKLGVPIWNTTSRQLLIDILIPLVTGGLLILIFIARGHLAMIAPACLIFYGLALIHGSRSTYVEVRYLGINEIALGLASALWPGFGLIFWTVGFGVMHIVYGMVVHFRYDK